MENGGELIRDNEERIFVSVRLRPLIDKEISSNDVSDWECISSDTIAYKNETRPMYPTAYTFDRVFRSDSSTRTVYEQGVKNAAISVVRGVNSSILAYGETSSGKTYTMTGVTEYAVADIYEYIEKHPEREFVVKFSAMEIYNECVRDLLSSNNTPLKLLDDPERGTGVENLTEEILRDRDHVTELLFICEAQRQTGGMLLPNELSTQSHQITRLTIQSSPREYLGWDSPSTLTAAVNFVDLGGSERASQSLSAGTRLKQDCHVDHSLLTLGAVIRRLSKGINEQIPYKDSKLTRILQPSLGGNARTALLCTMSPAHSHVEQSRNTLHFASCAKDVPTYAHVNVVMSDKALVKRLQKELARLENELRSSQPKFTPLNFSVLLREKDTQIERLEKEIRDLILQRDIFQSQVKELLKMLGDTASSITQVGVGNYPHLRVQRSPDVHLFGQDTPQYSDADTCDGLSRSNSGYRTVKVVYLDFDHSNASPNILLSGPSLSESDLFHGWHEIDKQTNASLEDVCREVNCRDRESATNYSYFQKNTRFPESKVHVHGNEQSALAKDKELMSSPLKEDDDVEEETPSRIMPSKEGQEPISETVIKVHVNGNQQSALAKDEELTASSLKEDDDVKEEIPSRIMPSKEGQEPVSETVIKGEESTSTMPTKKEGAHSSIPYPDNNASLQKNSLTQHETSFVSKGLNLVRSQSWDSSLISDSATPWSKMMEYTRSVASEKDCDECRRKLSTLNLTKEWQSLPEDTLDMETATLSRKTSNAEDCTSSTPDTKEKAYPQTEGEITTISEKENGDAERGVKEIRLEPVADKGRGLTSWPVEFKRLQREIIELWHACNVSLVHRTYFFMLFKGDPTDAIYLEVEIRRMRLLKGKFSRGNKIIVDGQRLTLSSSAKTLRQERRMLSEQMMKKLSELERDGLFLEWGIALNTKLRRLQLANLVWSKPEDIDHINESANLVAKLVGFLDPGQTPSKEVFGMNLTPKYATGICTYKRSLGSLL